ncbi:L,D-transpeptidase [Pseudonocardia bannensis]|uniref:L,D-transpeptidase n=1 Tax=Pseudonocardia bannensis TaxID=630973 RepID=A0A848DI32_9PSEU|nr:L,D-transpeptidase [Pseudonocardia bannensis]NMH92203.1 L,D-transpeptidase [Pseudonocardia bannensis]
MVAGLAAVGGSVLVGIGVAEPSPALPGLPPAAALPSADVLPLPPLPDLPAAANTDGEPPLPLFGAPAAAPAPSARPAEASAPAAAPAAPADTGSGVAAAQRTDPSGLVRGTPCTATARACVDVVGRWAWLLDGDQIVRGPVRIQTGDNEDPTPRGTFSVQWKAEQYTSREYLTPMPYSVFFAPGGIAFHEGRQDTYSAGCVKLVMEDAQAWFNYLQVGDEVQVK